jgi:hypothetical protein
MKKLLCDLPWAGDDGWDQIKRVEHKGQVLVVDPAEVLITRQQEAAAGEGCLGQDEGVMHFLGRQEVASAELPGQFIDQGRWAGKFKERPKAVLSPYEPQRAQGQAADRFRFRGIAEEGEFVQDARRHHEVGARHALIQDSKRIQNGVDLSGQIQQDVGINGQAQELHGRRAEPRPAGGVGDAAPLRVCSAAAGASRQQPSPVFSALTQVFASSR